MTADLLAPPPVRRLDFEDQGFLIVRAVFTRDGGDRREEHYREFLAWLRQKYAD